MNSKKMILAVFALIALFSAAAFADTYSGLLPLKLDVIEEEAFCGDVSLREIEIPETTKAIESRAFAGCEKLSAFYCYSKDVVIADNAFENTQNVCVYCFSGSTMDAYAQSKGFRIIYFDRFSVDCNTVNNGYKNIPITWKVTDIVPAEKIESTYVYRVFRNGTLVDSSGETNAEKYVYTPTASGSYRMEVSMTNRLVQTTAVSDNTAVAENLYLGTYEQDGNSATTDPVEWIVIHATEEKAFLLSKYILKTDSFFNPAWIKYKYCNWAGSLITTHRSSNNWYPSADYMGFKKINGVTMVPKKDGTYISNDDLTKLYHSRTWCNDTFYYGAFTDEERERILLTHNTNPENPSYSSIDGGPDTYDYVFFLSYEELVTYLPDISDRQTKNTDVAASQLGKKKPTYWWLRTRGGNNVNAACVYGSGTSAGKVWMSGSDVGHDCVGYRPAMWIKTGG